MSKAESIAVLLRDVEAACPCCGGDEEAASRHVTARFEYDCAAMHAAARALAEAKIKYTISRSEVADAVQQIGDDLTKFASEIRRESALQPERADGEVKG